MFPLAAASAGNVGFTTLPAGNNPFPNTVAIGIPPGCPSQEAQYGRSLEAALKARNIPVREISNVSFQVHSREDISQIQSAAQQPGPHVFINGRMMGHPSLDEVVAEAQRQGLTAK
ncbi:MAG: hypothetical protein WDN72_03900 [Alphaproteobacteria bacterium]